MNILLLSLLSHWYPCIKPHKPYYATIKPPLFMVVFINVHSYSPTAISIQPC
jgi:hypothetical protein